MNYKGGVRFSMLCGDRALENFEAKTEQMQTISNLLSAKPEKAAEAVSHLKEESGRKDGEINRLWQRIPHHAGRRLSAGAESADCI